MRIILTYLVHECYNKIRLITLNLFSTFNDESYAKNTCKMLHIFTLGGYMACLFPYQRM